MPQDFHHTLHALNAERPLASWIAMGLGAAGLALWSLWLVAAELPQQEQAVQVSRSGDRIVARFEGVTAAPETVLLTDATGSHLARVIHAMTDGGALLLHIDAPGDPLPQVALPLPPLHPWQVIRAALEGGA